MYKIIQINSNNSLVLENFIKNNIFSSTFRYFTKRDINCIKNHIITIILLYNDIPIGYAHIDHEDNKHWFGICIINEYQGKGLGKLMMEYLFEHEKIKQIDYIYLTVDKINIYAIKLYKNFGFTIIDEKQTHYTMLKKNVI